MGTKGSWRETIHKLIVAVGIIIACVLGIAIIVGIIGGYLYHWSWTGITNKTLWDWLNLLGVLAIPVVVGFGAVWFTTREGKVADAENTDNQRETALQDYIDKMSELLLEKKLRDSAEEDEVRQIAQVRTFTLLRRLDGNRRASVLLFLHQSGLIKNGERIIDLNHVDLSEAHLFQADLSEADLRGADFHHAYLSSVNLSGTCLNRTFFGGAFFFEPNFEKADLEGAYFCGAHLAGSDLSGVNLSGANFEESSDYRGAWLAFADLSGADLSAARLHGIDLISAKLIGAKLSNADLRGAYLAGADLSGADLGKANLRKVNLTGATVTAKQLEQAKSLKGATMPDGSIHS